MKLEDLIEERMTLEIMTEKSIKSSTNYQLYLTMKILLFICKILMYNGLIEKGRLF